MRDDRLDVGLVVALKAFSVRVLKLPEVIVKCVGNSPLSFGVYTKLVLVMRDGRLDVGPLIAPNAPTARVSKVAAGPSSCPETPL